MCQEALSLDVCQEEAGRSPPQLLPTLFSHAAGARGIAPTQRVNTLQHGGGVCRHVCALVSHVIHMRSC